MKKLIIAGLLCFISLSTFGQRDKEISLNKETNLFEATYFHDNGKVQQQGTFNLAGKLHGAWVSFDENGEKISEGSYLNGIKTGKWFFWNDGLMKEVEFNNNTIATVINKEAASGITRN